MVSIENSPAQVKGTVSVNTVFMNTGAAAGCVASCLIKLLANAHFVLAHRYVCCAAVLLFLIKKQATVTVIADLTCDVVLSTAKSPCRAGDEQYPTDFPLLISGFDG